MDTVLYLCNGTQCDVCTKEMIHGCMYTTDVNFAVNFDKDFISKDNVFYKENSNLGINSYSEKALRTIKEGMSNNEYLLEGIMGLNGEAGECIDILKKHIFQGHDLDRDELIKELGDVLWYLNLSAHSLGMTLEEIAEENINKLSVRYPVGYYDEDSINRDE